MIKWLQRNLFRRLLFSYLFTILLGFGVMGIIFSFFTTSLISENTETEMLRQAKSINLAIQHSDTITAQTIRNLEFFDQSFNKRIVIFDTTGKIVATSMSDEVYAGKDIERSILEEILEGNEVIQTLNVEGVNHPVLSIIVPWGIEDTIYGGIVLTAPITEIRTILSHVREIVLWAMVLGIIISTILVSYLSWSISRPLKKIEHAATEFALGNYEKRVEYQDEDEIGELAKSFNRMAEKLQIVENDRRSREQRRDDFLANVSHELRTPLTAMQGFLEALQDGLVKDEESRQRYYSVMYDESKYLNRLVEDLMELIQLEKKQVRLEKMSVHVEDIIKKVLVTLDKQIKEKGNVVHYTYKSTVPSLTADPIRIEQIIINLIQNANKFSDEGEITITTQYTTSTLTVTIADSGIGIPSHDVNRIWDRFFKVNRVRARNETGTGLGLAIVKELVNLHKGTISVESEVGKGTTFTLVFPIKRSLS